MAIAPGTPVERPLRTASTNDSGLPCSSRNMSGVAPAGAVSRPSSALTLPVRGVVVHQERAAADAGALRLDETEHRLHGHRRVDRLAALAQNLQPGLHRQRIGRRDQAWRSWRARRRNTPRAPAAAPPPRAAPRAARGPGLHPAAAGAGSGPAPASARPPAWNCRRERRRQAAGSSGSGCAAAAARLRHSSARHTRRRACPCSDAAWAHVRPVEAGAASAGSAGASVTSTEVTLEAVEPVHSQLTKEPTASASPHASTSTRPSAGCARSRGSPAPAHAARRWRGRTRPARGRPPDTSCTACSLRTRHRRRARIILEFRAAGLRGGCRPHAFCGNVAPATRRGAPRHDS